MAGDPETKVQSQRWFTFEARGYRDAVKVSVAARSEAIARYKGRREVLDRHGIRTRTDMLKLLEVSGDF